MYVTPNAEPEDERSTETWRTGKPPPEVCRRTSPPSMSHENASIDPSRSMVNSTRSFIHCTLPKFPSSASRASMRFKSSKGPTQISPHAPPLYPRQCPTAGSSVFLPMTNVSCPSTTRTSKSCTGPIPKRTGAPTSTSTTQISSPVGSLAAALDEKYTRVPSGEKQHARAYDAPMWVNCFIGPPFASTT